MIIHDDLKDLFHLLNVNDVEYVIVGGYAVAFHGFIRATKDIDILFRNSSSNINNLIKAIDSFGISAELLDHNTFSEMGRIVRIGESPMLVELINGIDGVHFDEVWRNKVLGKYGDEKVFFISLNDLKKTKKASGRPQDLRDLQELL